MSIRRQLLVACLLTIVPVMGCGRALNLPTWSPGPNAGLPGALIEGTLLFEDACFWISRSGTSADRVALLWPPGTTAVLDPPRVLDAGGSVIAQAGRRLEIGGGFVEMAAPGCATGGAWLVGEIIEDR